MKLRKLRPIFLILLFGSCSFSSMYVKNRSNDILDVPIIGAEEKIIGASVWVWCFGGGFQHGRRGEGFGIRGGNLGIYRTGGRGPCISVSDGDGSGLYLDQGNSFIVMNSNSHLTLSKKARYRNKNFSKYNTIYYSQWDLLILVKR